MKRSLVLASAALAVAIGIVLVLHASTRQAVGTGGLGKDGQGNSYGPSHDISQTRMNIATIRDEGSADQLKVSKDFAERARARWNSVSSVINELYFSRESQPFSEYIEARQERRQRLTALMEPGKAVFLAALVFGVNHDAAGMTSVRSLLVDLPEAFGVRTIDEARSLLAFVLDSASDGGMTQPARSLASSFLSKFIFGGESSSNQASPDHFKLGSEDLIRLRQAIEISLNETDEDGDGPQSILFRVGGAYLEESADLYDFFLALSERPILGSQIKYSIALELSLHMSLIGKDDRAIRFLISCLGGGTEAVPALDALHKLPLMNGLDSYASPVFNAIHERYRTEKEDPRIGEHLPNVREELLGHARDIPALAAAINMQLGVKQQLLTTAALMDFDGSPTLVAEALFDPNLSSNSKISLLLQIRNTALGKSGPTHLYARIHAALAGTIESALPQLAADPLLADLARECVASLRH